MDRSGTAHMGQLLLILGEQRHASDSIDRGRTDSGVFAQTYSCVAVVMEQLNRHRNILICNFAT